jgi:hypothetical protein
MTYQPTRADLALERRRKRIMAKIQRSTDRDELRALWRQFADLTAERSPGMVAHLERQMNLT